jgi:hypothetical protein
VSAVFDGQSRYAGLAIGELPAVGPDGQARSLRYVRRRFVPQPGGGAQLIAHVVTQGERLDVIAARYLGDPTQFWRICDANGALRPDELVESPGRILTITIAGIGG